MIEFANKKNVKVVSLAIAAIFVIGAFAIAVRGAGLTGGSGGTTDSAIGKVNLQPTGPGRPRQSRMLRWKCRKLPRMLKASTTKKART